MQCLSYLRFSHEILRKYELTLKSHPATPIKIEDYPNLNLNISNVDLDKLLPKYQGVICSIYTSASIEAASIGLPVITILDNNELNFSALYDDTRISFVSTKSELNEALIRQYQDINNIENNDIYFWTNPDLPLWSELLYNFYKMY